MYRVFWNGSCYDGIKYKTLGDAVAASQQYNAMFGTNGGVYYVVDKWGRFVA